jgi:RNA polymerase sigma-70 factor, ECF subfamily
VYSPNDAEDGELVQQCLAGDPSAFEPLVDRYQRTLFNVAYRLLGNHADARDATQNAFVRAYEHLDQFDRRRGFFSWIYRILKNDCLNMLRARRPLAPVDPHMSASGGPDEAFEAAERQRVVQAALQQLSNEYREVIVLRHFANLSYDEIAATLDVPVKTIKSRLYTARQNLAGILAEWKVRR